MLQLNALTLGLVLTSTYITGSVHALKSEQPSLILRTLGVRASVSCNKGYYRSNDECRECEDGYYCPGGTTGRQTCGAGKTTTRSKCESENDCTSTCQEKGKYRNGNSCEDCPEGYYCSGDGTRSTCATGYTTTKTKCDSSSQCTAVCREKGLYRDGNECKDCPTGSYCTGDGAKSTCATGYSTTKTKCDSSSQCTAVCKEKGLYRDGNECKDCPTGYYCTGDGTKSTCATGYSTTKAKCDSSSQCTAVCKEKGLYRDGNECKDCPTGSYCTGDGTKSTCATGYSTTKTNCDSSSQCTAVCKEKGLYRDGNECKDCPTGFYCTGDGTKSTCATGYSTTKTKCDSSSQCTAVCKEKGLYRDGNECKDCPTGSYCTGDGTKSACGAGYTTSSTKSYKSDDCYSTCMTMGKYLEGKECKDCPIGSYCSGDGLKVDCGIGFTTSVTKSIKKDECYATCLIQGKYLDGKECKDCPIGSYCTGLGTKISCPLGHTTLNVKSVDKADCVSTCREKGRYLDGAECKDCRKGHYCPGDGTDQTCAPGYTTSRTKCGEPSDCIPASPTPSGGVTSRRRAQTCNQGWSMCKLKTGRGEMQCVDTSNSLDMCGNCDNDCSTIPGARAVRCSVGLCVISECDPGLKPSGSRCVPKR